MPMKRMVLIVVCLLLAAGALAVERRVAVDAVVAPAGPLRFTGNVSIIVRPDAQWLYLSAFVYAGARPAAGGIMMLMGNRAANELDWYHLRVDGFAPVAGGLVALTFQAPTAGAAVYSGGATVPPLVRFDSPANDSHVVVGGAGNLTVSWSGGSPPYRLVIKPAAGGDAVFTKADVGGSRVDVPLARFAAGTRYLIYVSDAKRKFAFDRAVDPASNLSLHQTVHSFFYAD